MEKKYKKPAITNSSITNYTIYSISNCKYCNMAKEHINKIKLLLLRPAQNMHPKQMRPLCYYNKPLCPLPDR